MSTKKSNVDYSDSGVLMRLKNAIQEACQEIYACPDDSIQDIFNESLGKWDTGLKMSNSYSVENAD